MRAWRAAGGAALMTLLVCVSAVCIEDVEPQLTQEQIARLEKGNLIVFRKGAKDAQGNSRGEGRVMALINGPVDAVWTALTRDEDLPQFMPHLKAADRYSENGNEVGVRQSVKILWYNIQYHVIQNRDRAAGVISWQIDRGKKNDIVDTTGSWRLRPYGEGKTLAIYTIMVDSGMRFPQAVEDFLFNRDFPGVVKALKKWVESGRAKSKPDE